MKITKRPRPKIAIAAVVALALINVAVLAYLAMTRLLPVKYVLASAMILALATAIAGFFIIKFHKRKVSIVGYVIAVLTIGAGLFGVYTLERGMSLISNISGNTGKKITMSVIVKSESSLQNIDDVKGSRAGSVIRIDQKYIESVVSKAGMAGVDESESYPGLVDALYDNDQEIIIFNEAYRGIIKDSRGQFDKETRVIKSYDFYEENNDADPASISPDKAFNIYISGIDTYGDISTVSRSDVNILATVNPVKHSMLLTTIPRDSYVTIPGGGAGQKDKLTHAGLYGVDASIGAVENVLDTDVNGYMRINFTSLIMLVDEIGGITIQNPRSFTSIGGENFPAGQIELDGESALSYSRERYNLSGGDNERGKNQTRVISAILDKITSPGGLTNYQAVLSSIGESLQTNVSDQSIRQLINYQVDNPVSWKTESIALTGKGSTGAYPSYAMPNARLYMYVLDEASVQEAQTRIRESMNTN